MSPSRRALAAYSCDFPAAAAEIAALNDRPDFGVPCDLELEVRIALGAVGFQSFEKGFALQPG